MSYYRSGPPKPVIVTLSILGTLLLGAGGYFGITYYLQNRYTAFGIDDPAIITNDVLPLAETHLELDMSIDVDSDGDGYPDAIEIAAGTDPNVADTFSEENFVQFTYDLPKASIALEGTPIIFSSYVGMLPASCVRNSALVLSPVIEVSVPEFETNVFKAYLNIIYDFRQTENMNNEDIAIFRYKDDGSLEQMESVCPADGSVASTIISENGRYFVANKTLVHADGYNKTAIAICIDDSGSMYEDLNDPTCGKDIEGRRWDFVTSLVSNDLFNTKDTYITIQSFTAQTKELLPLTQMGSSKAIADAINAVKDATSQHENIGYFTGTSIYNAIQSGVNALNESDAATKYLIILTDGQPTDSMGIKSQINLLKPTRIIPIVVGLGDGIDFEELQDLADTNSGIYMPATSSKALELLAERTVQYVDGEIIDIAKLNGYDIVETIPTKVQMIADSGFRCDHDGLPFTSMPFYSKDRIYDSMNEGVSIVTSLLYSNKLLPAGLMYPNTVEDSFAELPIEEFSKMHLWKDVYNSYWGLGDKSVIYELNTIADTNSLKLKTISGALSKLTHVFSEDVPTDDKYYFDSNNNGVQDNGEQTIASFERALFNVDSIKSAVSKHKLGSLNKIEKAELELIYLAAWWQNYATVDTKNKFKYTSVYENYDGLLEISPSLGVYTNNISLVNIYNKLIQGDLCLLQLQSNDIKHIVAVYRMLRDYNNPDIIYLECYDSNTPSVPLIITLNFSHIVSRDTTTEYNPFVPVLNSISMNQAGYNYDNALVVDMPKLEAILEPIV